MSLAILAEFTTNNCNTRAARPEGRDTMKITIGSIIKVYGRKAIVRKVHALGTVDVETVDGKWFRVTGLYGKTI